MEQINLLWSILSPLENNKSMHKSLSELITAKLEAPQLSIRAAKKWGILNLSTSFYYNQIKELGELFIKGVISLKDFLMYSSSKTKVCDATYLKREGKKIYGAKVIKNYIVGSYELLQDVLFTVERYKGSNFIIDGGLKSGELMKEARKNSADDRWRKLYYLPLQEVHLARDCRKPVFGAW